jgi:hypothetical protein
VKSQRIGVGVVLVVLAISVVGPFITVGPRAALWPGLVAIFAGAVLYRIVRQQPTPRRWSKRRVIISAAVLGPVSAVVLGVLVGVVMSVPDWPTRLIAIFGIVLVPAMILWGTRMARQEDQAARGGGPDGMGDQQL